jgi:hypothetical protein
MLRGGSVETCDLREHRLYFSVTSGKTRRTCRARCQTQDRLAGNEPEAGMAALRTHTVMFRDLQGKITNAGT